MAESNTPEINAENRRQRAIVRETRHIRKEAVKVFFETLGFDPESIRTARIDAGQITIWQHAEGGLQKEIGLFTHTADLDADELEDTFLENLAMGVPEVDEIEVPD